MNKNKILQYLHALPEDDEDWTEIDQKIGFRILFDYVEKYALRFHELVTILCSKNETQAEELLFKVFKIDTFIFPVKEIRELFSDYTKRKYKAHVDEEHKRIQFVSGIYTVNVEVDNNYIYTDGYYAYVKDDYANNIETLNTLKHILLGVR